jgi:hypothetical protein
MKKVMLLAIVAGLGLTGRVTADEQTMPTPPATSKEFQQMKQLVGTWKGTEVGSTENQEVTVQYQLTAGGSALAETLGAGTPHEMLTVYADEGGKLGMTHYCMLGNHPRMQLTKTDAGEMDFEVKQRGAIGAKDRHMHSLAIYFQDPDHMMQKWTCYADGKENKIATFKLARVKS